MLMVRVRVRVRVREQMYMLTVRVREQMYVLMMLLGLPCVFTAVKCGSSGHNIRVAADLDSAAVGMVVIGNQLTATRQVSVFVSCAVLDMCQYTPKEPILKILYRAKTVFMHLAITPPKVNRFE